MSRYSIYKNIILEDERSKILRFNKVDNRFHYVYRITEIKTKKHYYGSRTSIKEPLLDLINYGTSSKRKLDIINNPENYKFKIIKVFDNSGDKMLYESFLHQYFNVKEKDNRFWNKSNQTPWGFDTTGLKFETYNRPSRKGISWGNHTDETKNKISEKNIIRFSDKKERDKVSLSVKKYADNNPEKVKKRYENRKLNGNDSNQTKILIIEKLNGEKIELYGQKSLEEYCKFNNMSFRKMKRSIGKGLIEINEEDKRTSEESKRCKNLKIYKKT